MPVALVTGAARGIGHAVAGHLARLGYTLFLADIDEDAVTARADDLARNQRVRTSPSKLDVRDPDAWEQLARRVVDAEGHLDVLLNIAGIIEVGWAHELERSAIDRQVDINLKGVIYGSNAAAREMIKRRRGHIVNIASLAGIAGIPGISVYSATKHAVRGFSLAIAQELAEHDVAVTVVCPGLVDTHMLDVQVVRDEAALTFSGPRALTTEEVSKKICDALRDRPIELNIDAPWSGQAFMAKVASAMPSLSQQMLPVLRRAGARRQEARRKRGG